MSHQAARLPFESDGDTLRTDSVSPVSNCLARFEFECGRGNEGTKILMLEWEDDGDNAMWEVSWEGKRAVLSAKEKDDTQHLHRLYFMLGPGQTIPPLVKIEQTKGGQSTEREPGKVLYANPLPAIFPKELGISGRDSGKKGVLHTRWAKRRLASLKEEIEREKRNVEGVGLDMAIKEREWIIENFGVVGGSHSTDATHSPRTPSGGRLSEKLKGLKLGTSTADLHSIHVAAGNIQPNPLSPATGDLAFSSFALFHATSEAYHRGPAVPPHPSIAHHIAASRSSGRMSSLDAITRADSPSHAAMIAAAAAVDDDDDDGPDDDLFAVKLSPRSPEMAKSPFSFPDPKRETFAA